MMDCDLTWYALASLQGIGPKSLWRLTDDARSSGQSVCGVIRQSRAISPDFAKVLPLLDDADLVSLGAEVGVLVTRRVRLLHPDLEAFPRGVVEHGQNLGLPPLLFARGHLPLARSTGVAIVGSRNVDEDGLRITRELAGALAAAGLNVVSGYAKGVDATAHAAALRAEGTTTMVLAEGILGFEARREMRPLLSATNSLVLSQFHPKARWTGRNAMARNKLVCALSEAVVVIASGPERDERGRSSGTFDAARTALGMHLPVFVVSPRAFQTAPIGNAALLRLGCRELFLDDPVKQITGALQGAAIPARAEEGHQIAMF